jgi:hypothetical protein
MTMTAEDVHALAQMCKRFCYHNAARFANRFDGGNEREHALEAGIRELYSGHGY